MGKITQIGREAGEGQRGWEGNSIRNYGKNRRKRRLGGLSGAAARTGNFKK